MCHHPCLQEFRKDRFCPRVLGPRGFKPLLSPPPLSLSKSQIIHGPCPTVSAPSPTPRSQQSPQPRVTAPMHLCLCLRLWDRDQASSLESGLSQHCLKERLLPGKCCFRASGWPSAGRKQEAPRRLEEALAFKTPLTEEMESQGNFHSPAGRGYVRQPQSLHPLQFRKSHYPGLTRHCRTKMEALIPKGSSCFS